MTAPARGGAPARGEGSRRVRGTVLHVPIVHGSHAVWQGPRSTETRSHRWWLYLRPLDNVDISHFIRDVEFVLHDSFEPPLRRVSSMPYEMSEYGWGEFDAVIRVHFQDPAERPVEFFHPLKLFVSPDAEFTKKPVVHEFYDEIVFQDPSERLLQMLKTTPHGPGTRLKQSALAAWYRDFSGQENRDLKKIEEARARVRAETDVKRERWEQLDKERAELVREIADLEAKKA
jgi:YEATS domain-containing protein 4